MSPRKENVHQFNVFKAAGGDNDGVFIYQYYNIPETAKNTIDLAKKLEESLYYIANNSLTDKLDEIYRNF